MRIDITIEPGDFISHDTGEQLRIGILNATETHVGHLVDRVIVSTAADLRWRP